MTESTQQAVYMVEKFIPTQCPNPGCYNEFKSNGADGFYLATYFLHEPGEVTEQITASISFGGLSTDLIVCAKCRNVTLRVKIEDRVFATREEAEVALQDGFVNLHEMTAYGIPRLGRFVYHNAGTPLHHLIDEFNKPTE